MNSERLKFFIQAASTLSFSKVARQNYLSQSTISHQIELLEDELKVKLFYRNGKKLSLTKEGIHFIPRAEKIIRDIDEAIFELQNFSTQTPKLSIIFPETGFGFIRTHVAQFIKEHDDVLMNMKCGSSSDILSAFVNDDYDIIYTYENMSNTNKSYDYINYTSDHLCLVTPRSFPAIDEADLFKGLESIPFLGLSSNPSSYLWRDIHMVFEHNGFSPYKIHTYDRMSHILDAVNLGIGFSILPYNCICDSNIDVNYASVNEKGTVLAHSIFWKKSNDNPALGLFKNFLKSADIKFERMSDI